MNFCYYNFVKTHGAIRITPTQAAGWRIARGRSRKWLNAVPAVSQLHNCSATWRGTVPVHDLQLHGHPQAKRTYAWSYLDGGKDEKERLPVLEIPPVDSAQNAVQVQIVKDLKVASIHNLLGWMAVFVAAVLSAYVFYIGIKK